MDCRVKPGNDESEGNRRVAIVGEIGFARHRSTRAKIWRTGLRSRKAWFIAAITLGGLLAAIPAGVRAEDDAKLLATFCAAKDIKGSTCRNARGYQSGMVCDVKLGEDRYRGRFLADSTILVVRYESGCEAHATDNGGSVVFEADGDRVVFRGYQPGYPVNDCIAIPGNAEQGRLICLTGHIGQGILESGVAEMVFTREFDQAIKLAYDFLMTAEDATGAFGSNTVTCKETSKYFSLDGLRAGPRPDTVAVDAAYADGDTVRTACAQGFPRPAEVFGKLVPGDAYVPDGYEKNATFVIDLVTRKAVAEPAAGTAAPH
jgi:hypothetical protein